MDALVSACIVMSIAASVALVIQLRNHHSERARFLSTRRECNTDANRYTPPLTQPMPRTAASSPGVHPPRHSDIIGVILKFESTHEEAFLISKDLDGIDASPPPRAVAIELTHYLCCVRRLIDPFTLRIGLKLRQQPERPTFGEPIEFSGLPGKERTTLIQERLDSSLKKHLEKLAHR